MPSLEKKSYWITKELAKDLTKLASAMYAEKHPEAEINNPKPLFEALGIKKPMSMEQKLDRLFAGPRGLIEQMYDQGEETPDDFNDFNIPDDIEPISPYEFQEMQPEEPSSFSSNQQPSEPTDPPPDPSKAHQDTGPEDNPPEVEES